MSITTTPKTYAVREVELASGFMSGNENMEESLDFEGVSCLLTS
jgi:hypothetical protein